MHKLVLIRHGESTWNLENRFTGWTDVPLTATGVEQARQAGRLLRDEGYDFDIAYTSVLKRAIWTLWHALDGMSPAATLFASNTSSLSIVEQARATTAAKRTALVTRTCARMASW